LIDEIDKAPRDFPNDLLNEMENYEFDIKELNQSIRKPSGDARIVVIMTSNSEKNLPNAFLRRCVFYHIPFPDKEKLMTITRKRMAIGNNHYDRILNEAIDKFIEYRQQSINKKPATSEFLDWMNILKEFNLLHSNGSFGNYGNVPEQRKYESSLNVLFKNKEDIDRIINKTV
jgi:MoxR-like ATPase